MRRSSAGHVRLTVAVDGDGVDVVGVAIGEDPPWLTSTIRSMGFSTGTCGRVRGGQSWGGGGVGGGEGDGEGCWQEHPGLRDGFLHALLSGMLTPLGHL